jgi:hypothetical protein
MMKVTARARQKRGTRFMCVASRSAGRLSLSFVLTFRPAVGRRKPQFQVTCEHHEPEQCINKNGRPYRLACRRTATVHGDTPEDQRATIKRVLRWVRRGPLVACRVEHQKIPDDDGSSSSSDSSSSSSVSNPSVSNPSAPNRGGTKSPAAHAGAPAVDAPSLDSVAPVVDAPSLNSHECWLCGEGHHEAACPVYRLLLVGTDVVQRSRAVVRPIGIIGRDSVLIPKGLFALKDVPGDGNCLFHAIGRELDSIFPKHPQLPTNSSDGQS